MTIRQILVKCEILFKVVTLDSKQKNENKEVITESCAAATKKKLKKTIKNTGEIS